MNNNRDCKHGRLARSCEICDLEKQSDRYEKIRRLNPRQFGELWQRNLKGENFDDMIDALTAMPNDQAQRPAQTTHE